jgi:hypothetical protein
MRNACLDNPHHALNLPHPICRVPPIRRTHDPSLDVETLLLVAVQVSRRKTVGATFHPTARRQGRLCARGRLRGSVNEPASGVWEVDDARITQARWHLEESEGESVVEEQS